MYTVGFEMSACSAGSNAMPWIPRDEVAIVFTTEETTPSNLSLSVNFPLCVSNVKLTVRAEGNGRGASEVAYERLGRKANGDCADV
jgi:hypothetical protein